LKYLILISSSHVLQSRAPLHTWRSCTMIGCLSGNHVLGMRTDHFMPFPLSDGSAVQ